jgi:hypothetical protein
MPEESWILEHKERQKRLVMALRLGLIDEKLSEILDLADNSIQAKLVSIIKHFKGEQNND